METESVPLLLQSLLGEVPAAAPQAVRHFQGLVARGQHAIHSEANLASRQSLP